MFAILSYLSRTHNVEILHNRTVRTDLGIPQQHKISSESLKWPVGIALPQR